MMDEVSSKERTPPMRNDSAVIFRGCEREYSALEGDGSERLPVAVTIRRCQVHQGGNCTSYHLPRSL